MIKRTRRILSVTLVITICSIFLYLTPVKAQAINNAINGAQLFINQSNGTTVINPTKWYDLWNTVYGILYGLAIALSIVQGIFLGMRMILGTIGEKVDAKEKMRKYILTVLGIAFGGVVLKAILEWLVSLVI